jgi:hypothetical protein
MIQWFAMIACIIHVADHSWQFTNFLCIEVATSRTALSIVLSAFEVRICAVDVGGVGAHEKPTKNQAEHALTCCNFILFSCFGCICPRFVCLYYLDLFYSLFLIFLTDP